jgi:O-methyltransferase
MNTTPFRNDVLGSAATSSSAELYLDLIKRCLTDSIFLDDPLANYREYRQKRAKALWKRLFMSWLIKILTRRQLKIVEPYSIPWIASYADLTLKQVAEMRENGRDWPARAHTMIGMKRLNNLQYCVETALKDSIPGDLIETGVWRGGACIFMRAILKAHNESERRVWVADSFAGLPSPNEAEYSADAGDQHHSYSDWLAVSKTEVAKNFSCYGLLDEQVVFLEGWFKDTLPTAPITSLAVMRLDGDMYESTTQALDALYHKLSPGGFVIIDDYCLEPCAKAVNDFRSRQNIDDPIREIDGSGVYWRRC